MTTEISPTGRTRFFDGERLTAADLLAAQAYERGEIGDSDLANYLRCDIAAARDVVDRVKTSRDIGDSGEDAAVRLQLDRSLLGGAA